MMKCPKWNPETRNCTIQTMDRPMNFVDDDGNVKEKVYKAKCTNPDDYDMCPRFLQFRDLGRLGSKKRVPPNVGSCAVPAKTREHKSLSAAHVQPKAARIKKDGLAAIDTFKKAD